MNSELHKAISAADTILKGQKPNITAAALESAMLKHADDERRPGESSAAAALVRLLDERDQVVTKLSRAIDIARYAEENQQPNAETRTAKARLYDQATDLLDAHVAKQRRDGETTAAAHARLAREAEPTFVSIWSQLRSVQDL